MARKFPLRIELVPKPLWGQNLRSNRVGLGPYRWLALSRAVRAELGRCSICGSMKRLQGHEVWKFREKQRSGVATLTRVNAICTVCHSVQHWGRTKMLIAGGLKSMADDRLAPAGVHRLVGNIRIDHPHGGLDQRAAVVDLTGALPPYSLFHIHAVPSDEA
jgi:hypothetical protein